MNFKPLENEFINLSTKFLFLSQGSSKEQLNEILNDLNSLDYKNQQISDCKPIIRLIESFKSIPTTDDTLIVKCCCLMKSLISKQKLELRDNVSSDLVNWILQSLENCFHSVLCDATNVLKILFKSNSRVAQKHADLLLSTNGFLIKLLEDPSYRSGKFLNVDASTNEEIYVSVLSCIESILSHLADVTNDFELPDEVLEVTGRTIMHLLYQLKIDDFNEIGFYNIITSALNCLRLICQQHASWATENIGDLMGISKAFVMFGLPDISPQLPQKIMSSQQAILEPHHLTPSKSNIRAMKPRKMKMKGKKKPKESHPEENLSRQPYTASSIVIDEVTPVSSQLYKTSDSDFSDNESNRAFVSRHKQSKMRQAALLLVSMLAQNTEKRVMFGYWHSLFPTEDAASNPSLLNSLLRDSSLRCKIIALQATSFLLHGSRLFLIQAESNEKAPASFTPFSVALGNMVTAMYEKLTQALVKESDLTVLAQILKCITVFVQATPFHRLKVGIVGSFVKYVRLLVRHKNPTIKVAALMLMGHLISNNDITPEIYELVEIPKSNVYFDRKAMDENVRKMMVIDQDEMIELDLDEDEFEEEIVEEKKEDQQVTMSWLLQIVLENLGITSMGSKISPSAATSVRIESLQVLSAMTTHFLLLKPHLNLIALTLINALRDSVPDVRLYAIKALDFVGQSINNYLSSQERLDHLDVESSVSFWLNVLPLAIEQITDIKQSSTLRSGCCDALAYIGVLVFEKMPHDKQMLLISVLSGCACDEEPSLRASAVRVLAVYAIFPSLRVDLGFIENTTECILRIISNKNTLIKIKASWALGNVVDALIMIKDEESEGKFNMNLLRQMLEVNLEACHDNDKIRCNAVRTIGNILKLLTRENLDDPVWFNLFERSLKELNYNLMNCANVKVKWNCCYALGSLIKNPLYYEEKLKAKWQGVVFPNLCNTIKTSSNFKVRIHATTSMTMAQNRTDFGSYFNEVWSTLLVALEQSDHLTDFNEYKHRYNLQEQLCASLSHMINLMELEDAVPMKNELFPLIDITKQNWDRVLNRLLPEKSAPIITACARLANLELLARNSEQKNAINIIGSCFKPVEQDLF